MVMDLSSPAFSHNGQIPVEHTCDGADRAPALRWKGAPAGTRSFALIVEDPDAPGRTFVHWLVYDLPAGATQLGQGGALPQEAKHGRNDFGRDGYGGPCPPRGHGVHHYHFSFYALDVPSLGLPPGAPLPALRHAMQGHVLAQARLTGLYSR